MVDTRTNLLYDPYRQGADTNSWRFYGTTPTIGSKGFSLSTGAMMHYGDILKGKFEFDVNILNRLSTEDKFFGLKNYGNDVLIGFQLLAGSFSATCKNGTTTTSVSLVWDSSWNTNQITLGIIWEAGIVKFFINDVQVARISDNSVPSETLALYIENNRSEVASIANIRAIGMQYFRMNAVPSTITGGFMTDKFTTIVDSVSITESVTLVRI